MREPGTSARIEIEARDCPQCGQSRIPRLLDGFFVCPACHIQWKRIDAYDFVEPLREPEPQPPDEPAFPFGDRELRRLASYRAAVRAGFYSG